MNDSDDELRRLLREVGQKNRRHAPPFHRVWPSVVAPREFVSVWRWASWALGATAAAAVLVLFISHPTAPSTRPDEPLPTDFLLTTAADAQTDRVAGEINALLQP